MFYTGRGDDGTSSVFGTAKRCNKAGPVFDALGTVDELNSLLGVCYAKAQAQTGTVSDSDKISVPKIIRRLQEDLFIIQAELAGADKHLSSEHLMQVEMVIAEVSTKLERPEGFVIPGSSELSAYLDFARSVSRRAERSVLAAAGECEVSKDTKAYLNRLSSILYVLARYVARAADVKEQNPKY